MVMLWEPTYYPSNKFAFVRPYNDWIGATWWNVSYVQFDSTWLVLQENLFGGNRMHFKWRQGMFDWSRKTCLLTQLFTEVYLTAPGGSTPLDGGPWTVQWRNVVGFENPCLYLFPDGRDGILHHRELPRGPSTYWNGEFPIITPS